MVQGMVTTPHPSHCPKIECSTSSGTAGHPSDMVTGATLNRKGRRPTTSPDTDDKTAYHEYNRQFRQPTTPGKTDPHQHLLGAITTQSNQIHMINLSLLQTQVPTLSGSNKEQRLQNHVPPMSRRLSAEANLQYFQSLLRKEAVVFCQSLTVTTETTLNDVLTKFRRKFRNTQLRVAARFKWDQINRSAQSKLSKISSKPSKSLSSKYFKKMRDKKMNLSLRPTPDLNPARVDESQ